MSGLLVFIHRREPVVDNHLILSGVIDNITLYDEDGTTVDNYSFEYRPIPRYGMPFFENNKAPSEYFKADFLSHTRYRDYFNWSTMPLVHIYTPFFAKKTVASIAYDEVNILVPRCPWFVMTYSHLEYPLLSSIEDVKTLSAISAIYIEDEKAISTEDEIKVILLEIKVI